MLIGIQFYTRTYVNATLTNKKFNRITSNRRRRRKMRKQIAPQCHKILPQIRYFRTRLRNFLSAIRLINRTQIPKYTLPNPEMCLHPLSKWCSSWNTRKQLQKAAGHNNYDHNSGSMQWRNVGYRRPPAGAPVAHFAPLSPQEAVLLNFSF